MRKGVPLNVIGLTVQDNSKENANHEYSGSQAETQESNCDYRMAGVSQGLGMDTQQAGTWNAPEQSPAIQPRAL